MDDDDIMKCTLQIRRPYTNSTRASEHQSGWNLRSSQGLPPGFQAPRIV